MKNISKLLLIFLVLVSTALAVNTNPQVLEFVVNNSGSVNANVDGSVTPQIFQVGPPENETWIISRMMIHIEDTGGTATNKYGSVNQLANGTIIRTNISGVIYNFTDEPVDSNADWGEYNYDVTYLNFGGGNANEVINSRWTFSNGGAYVKLEYGDSFQVVIQDDISALVEHTFLIHGYKLEEVDNMSLPVLIGLILLGVISVGAVLLTRKGLFAKVIGTLTALLGIIMGIQFSILYYLGATSAELANLLSSWYEISTRFFIVAIAISVIWLMAVTFRTLIGGSKSNEEDDLHQ